VLTVVEGRVQERRIRTGRRDGQRVEVLDGLRSGDLIILEPGDLIDGVPVRPDSSE
jgi:multidrug efflux pump subunit AcrA (membrane-fusion protein)